MEKRIYDILSRKTPPKEVDDLMTKCKDLVKVSRDTMKDYYDRWDRADRVYRGERYVDDQDKKAIARGEPAKVIVPLSFAQVQTFVAACTSMYTQRDYFYELGGTGIEDVRPAKLGQATLERDLSYNKFKGVLLPQWLTDVARYGIGIFKSDWINRTVPTLQMVPDPDFQPVPGLPAQTEVPMVPQYVDMTEYLGNRITVVNPYRWFPDTRLPITRYREGEFCADETEYAKPELKKMEAAGQCAGVGHIPQPTNEMCVDRRSPIITKSYVQQITMAKTDDHYVLITEIQIRLNPAKTKIDGEAVLDKNCDKELLHYVWIANDQRIIRIEPCGYDHEDFLFDAAQFFNDQGRCLNFGLSELIGPSQDVLDWLMNSRIANVRKVIQNQLIVDPRFIEMEDLKARNPVLRLKSTASVGLALNTYIQQLQVTDVTTGHLTDMQNVSNFVKEATGISDNLLGNYSSGRRSARQTDAVASATAVRLQVIASGLWESGLLPLGRKMLSNLRQGLDQAQLVRIIGLQNFVKDQQAVQDFLTVDKSMLVGNYDFLIFDATLPSQRQASAFALQELLVALSKDPRLVLVFNKDPQLILDEVLELRNIRNADRFNLSPQRAAQLIALAGGPGNQANAGGTPPRGGGQSSGGVPPGQ